MATSLYFFILGLLLLPICTQSQDFFPFDSTSLFELEPNNGASFRSSNNLPFKSSRVLIEAPSIRGQQLRKHRGQRVIEAGPIFRRDLPHDDSVLITGDERSLFDTDPGRGRERQVFVAQPPAPPPPPEDEEEASNDDAGGGSQFAVAQNSKQATYHGQSDRGKNTQIIITLNHEPKSYVIGGKDGHKYEPGEIYQEEKKEVEVVMPPSPPSNDPVVIQNPAPVYQAPANDPPQVPRPSYQAPANDLPQGPPRPRPSYQAPANDAPLPPGPSYQAPSNDIPQAPSRPRPSYQAPANDAPLPPGPSYQTPSNDIPQAPSRPRPSYQAPANDLPQAPRPSYQAPSNDFQGFNNNFNPTPFQPDFQDTSFDSTFANPAPSSYDVPLIPNDFPLPQAPPQSNYGNQNSQRAPQQSYNVPQQSPSNGFQQRPTNSYNQASQQSFGFDDSSFSLGTGYQPPPLPPQAPPSTYQSSFQDPQQFQQAPPGPAPPAPPPPPPPPPGPVAPPAPPPPPPPPPRPRPTPPPTSYYDDSYSRYDTDDSFDRSLDVMSAPISRSDSFLPSAEPLSTGYGVPRAPPVASPPTYQPPAAPPASPPASYQPPAAPPAQSPTTIQLVASSPAFQAAPAPAPAQVVFATVQQQQPQTQVLLSPVQTVQQSPLVLSAPVSSGYGATQSLQLSPTQFAAAPSGASHVHLHLSQDAPDLIASDFVQAAPTGHYGGGGGIRSPRRPSFFPRQRSPNGMAETLRMKCFLFCGLNHTEFGKKKKKK